MEAVHRHAGEPSAEGVVTPPRLPPPVTVREDGRRAGSRAADISRAALADIAPLFDITFQKVAIERVFAVIQVVATLALLYAAAELAAHGFALSVGRGLLNVLFVGPALVLGGLAVLRAAFVLVLALLRIADRLDDLGRIADRMDDLGRVADNMEELGELPRWVRGLSPLRRLRPGPEPPRRGEAPPVPE